jgi:hypothetical protein
MQWLCKQFYTQEQSYLNIFYSINRYILSSNTMIWHNSGLWLIKHLRKHVYTIKVYFLNSWMFI